ncbi:MAG TPA: ribonuclease HII [Pyrinomonadaceae bacterium]|nr:ribonuclease HII [Pyrinomonadaceae bacterium]
MRFSAVCFLKYDGVMPNLQLFPDQTKIDDAGSTIGTLFEDQARSEGYRFIAGVDEVGRGCLAGPVVAGACILDLSKPIPEFLNDSKQVSEKRRIGLDEQIRATCVAFAIGEVSAEEIDATDILRATMKAMKIAIMSLEPAADYLLIDALRLKEILLPQKAIIKGDATSVSIAAASIIAKTYRDDLMKRHAEGFPQYGFEKHVGYGTTAHFAAIREHGPCELHRKSFKGVL